MSAAVALGQEGSGSSAVGLSPKPGQPSEPFGVYVFAADAPESELARHVEREVFYEYFNNTLSSSRRSTGVRGLDRLRLRVGSPTGTSGRCPSDSYCRHLRA